MMVLLSVNLFGCTAAQLQLPMDTTTEDRLFYNQRAVYALDEQGNLTVKTLKESMDLNGGFYSFDCVMAEGTNAYEVTAHNEESGMTASRIYQLGTVPVQVTDPEELRKLELTVLNCVNSKFLSRLLRYYVDSEKCAVKGYGVLWDTAEFDGDSITLPMEIMMEDGNQYVTLPLFCYRKENGTYLLQLGDSDELNQLYEEADQKYFMAPA